MAEQGREREGQSGGESGVAGGGVAVWLCPASVGGGAVAGGVAGESG